MMNLRVPLRAISTLLALGPVCAAAGAQGQLLYQFDGQTQSEGQHLGAAVARAGDWNLDAHADIAVGAPDATAPGPLLQAGRVEVFSVATRTVLATVTGTVAEQRLGAAVAGGVDLNDDNIPDIVVGAPGLPGTSSVIGSIVAVFGPSGSSTTTLSVGTADDGFGSTLAVVGDMNLDGVPDLVVGAIGQNVTGNGKIFVVFGGATLTQGGMVEGTSSQVLGASLCGAGDQNGDGRADFAAGAPRTTVGANSQAGVTRVYSGDGSLTVLRTYFGSGALELSGWSVANAGRVDKDGVDDLIIGAPRASIEVASEVGVARVFSGAKGKLLAQLFGGFEGAQFGWSVAGLGDATVDGFGEVAVGSALEGGGGRVRAYSGKNFAQIFIFSGGPGDEFGAALANAGDVNADGLEDLLIGGPSANPSDVADSGSTRLQSLAGAGDFQNTNLKGKRDVPRTVAQPDADAAGKVELRFEKTVQRFILSGLKLPTDQGALSAFLEDGVDLGSFTTIGEMTLKNNKTGLYELNLSANGQAPSALGTHSISALGNRRIEIRTASNTVLLAGIVPPLNQKNYKSTVAFAPQNGSAAKGTATSVFTAASGSSTFTVKTSGLDKTQPADLLLETGIGTGVFESIGALNKGTLTRNTKKGEALPGGVSKLERLAGLRLRVVQNATIVLEAAL
ncbi:MAG: FG-GAP repeat protein [Planctomycetes bacterium]|nr:FG-GAP repeat protein [Planctomycetota bacterium]